MYGLFLLHQSPHRYPSWKMAGSAWMICRLNLGNIWTIPYRLWATHVRVNGSPWSSRDLHVVSFHAQKVLSYVSYKIMSYGYRQCLTILEEQVSGLRPLLDHHVLNLIGSVLVFMGWIVVMINEVYGSRVYVVHNGCQSIYSSYLLYTHGRPRWHEV